ncbi:acyltransferase [Protaetiibacter intestinalis]|uniref:Acyltransferase n=1 Tax=Protaetiibacter intestinalis TaxID=2419774 RepID=A0A387BCS3_9MICO|nr:acyltransferase [Protaetiibacter intestinalis]AYF98916.1 acyltransferase [Protaetiibacter intestinalis]
MNTLEFLMGLQRARDAAFSMLAARGFHSFGRGSRILLPFRTGNPDLISIGSGVIVGAGSWLMSPAREHPGPVIELHDRARINQTSITAVQSVVIEEGVDIARGCYITDHSHSFERGDIPIRDQPLARVAPVRICRGAWLGQNVVVLPGVTIGENAVVGANSVVRDDVPARAVVAGAPARVIRQLA